MESKEEVLGIKLYTLEQVAELLKVSERTVYQYVKDNKLKAQKIGRTWKFTEDAIKDFIRGN